MKRTGSRCTHAALDSSAEAGASGARAEAAFGPPSDANSEVEEDARSGLAAAPRTGRQEGVVVYSRGRERRTREREEMERKRDEPAHGPRRSSGTVHGHAAKRQRPGLDINLQQEENCASQALEETTVNHDAKDFECEPLRGTYSAHLAVRAHV